MNENPLLKLKALGQSLWLDYIERGMLDNGKIALLIERDGLAGITSNPAIFEKAILGHAEYQRAIVETARRGLNAAQIYETLVVEDVGRAADLFLSVYERTGGRDGYVSIEVSPHWANDAVQTMKEATRLWKRLRRPNVMIKVPATAQGLPAIRQLIAEGINVNVTLLFGLARYREVAQAFMAGLEDRAAAGLPLENVDSVASFFLSRIDVLVDKQLDALVHGGNVSASGLRGAAAIASARLAYQIYKESIATERWRRLVSRGARPQRLLWASTGTKDPAYSDVKYVEALIGPDTINTLPLETLDAYRDHGRPAPRLERELAQAAELPDKLRRLGIDLTVVARQLKIEGVQKFIEPFDRLLFALETHQRQILAESA